MKALTLTAAVGLASLLIFGCQKPSDTIKIGLAGVQTGPDGQIGSTMFYGSQIAIEEWNEKGGVLSKKIEAISRDDEAKPQQAVAVAQELVASGIVAVIGHFNSGCTIPSSEIYSQNKVIQITPGSTNPTVTERGIRSLFRIVGRDDQQGSCAAEFVSGTLAKQKVAVLHNKTAYGQGLAEEFKKTYEQMGGTVVLFDGLGAEDLDFRATLSAVANAGAEALFWGGMYGQAAPMLVQLRSSGSAIPFISGDGSIVPEFISTAGAHASEVYLTFGPDYKTAQGSKAFLDKYRKRFGEEGPYSVYGYDAVNILLSAIEKAGTTDSDKVAETIRSGTFTTTLGDISFDDKGDLAKSYYILWTVRDGKFTPLN